MDGKYEKVRKELINLFSNYIGSGNKLTYFYLSSVINAKVREIILNLVILLRNQLLKI